MENIRPSELSETEEFEKETEIEKVIEVASSISYKEVLRYNFNLLLDIIKRDEPHIDIEYYKKLNIKRETKIKYTCKCGENGEKTLRSLYDFGSFCKKCTNVNKSEKTIKTCQERYNETNPLKNKSVREKANNTNIILYGFKNAMQHKSVQEKGQNTLFEKHGFKYVFQIKEFQDKSIDTFMKKHNVRHPSHIPTVSIKSAYKTKDYVMPDGTVIKIQGYEHWALDKLFQNGLQINDVITEKDQVPEIFYNIDNKNHRYYCDIFVKSQNKIIEVKSDYTYSLNIDVNMEKAKACLDKGYLFEFWVFDKNQKLEVFQVEYE